MTTSKAEDLTDTWQGRFSFPRLYEPVSFTARIEHTDDTVLGSVEELGVRGAAAGKRLTSTITGTAIGGAVTFLKTYDAFAAGYDAVHYAGTVGDGGLEISGVWTIPGNWSGTFLMIRSRGLELALSKTRVERI